MYDERKIKAYVKENIDEVYKIIYELCQIPAPSHHEEERAKYCKAWFDGNGLEGSYIDEALNVILPYQAEGRDSLTVLAAHTDTVFPDTAPMPYEDDGEYIRSPGVGDDTTSLAVLMLVAKYYVVNNVKTDGMLFVANSCEEGLGNLKGTRQLFKDFEGRIRLFVSFDAKMGGVVDRSVGSHRYEIEVSTPGGHSWSAFGNKNALAELSRIVTDIYAIELPVKPGKKVTFNVGTMEGGTSVNTIAQSAKMLCEYRSDDVDLLAYMQNKFEEIFKNAEKEDVKVNVTLVGNRPCEKGVDENERERIKKIASDVLLEVLGKPASYHAGSTDCNIPLSLGIPAICVGVYVGGGTHTREEWVLKKSVVSGFEVGLKTMLRYTESK